MLQRGSGRTRYPPADGGTAAEYAYMRRMRKKTKEMMAGREPGSIGRNILLLRHRLKMTQAEFIDMFLKKEDGAPMFSVAKLSNIETKGSSDEERVAQIIAEKLGIQPSVFQRSPEGFERSIDGLLVHSEAENAWMRFSEEEPARSRLSYSSSILEVLSDYLAENITAGKLHAGDQLPEDRTLAELTGVSRSAVREALKVLGAIGVVNILPGSGVYLAKSTREIFTLPFSWTILLSTDSNQNVYQLRALLEREAVRLAMERRGEAAFEKIRAVVEREGEMLEKGDYGALYRCDMEFHMSIASCAGNELLTNLLYTCRKILAFLNALGMSTASQIQEMRREHAALFHAMEQGESERAQELIVEHLRRAERRYQGKTKE